MNTMIRRRLIESISLLVMTGLSQACAPPIYCAKATHGIVVDATTEQPVADAVVVAQWMLSWGARGQEKPYEVSEAIADASGAYVLPGWGPRLRPLAARFDYFAPRLLVFKSGYVPRVFYNVDGRDRIVHSSEWDGKSLSITPFRGTPEERDRDLMFVIDMCRERHGRSLFKLYRELLKEKHPLKRGAIFAVEVAAETCIDADRPKRER